MGNACCKSENAVAVDQPRAERGQLARRNQPMPVRSSVMENNLVIETNNDVNKRYAEFFEIIKEKYTGQGIKMTPSYKSKIPKEEVDRKRTEYWETQVEGNTDVWQAMRSACESDEETAQAILAVLEIKLVNNSLQQAFDRQGNKYDVPIFCINNPLKYEIIQKKQTTKEEFSSEIFKIKFRRVGVPHDLELEIAKNFTILELKEAYINKVQEEDLKPMNLRLFFGGRELVENSILGEYKVESEHVIQIYVKK